jgi:hypothetical protein
MKKFVWSIGLFFLLVTFTSKNTPNRNRVNPWAFLREPVIGACFCPYDYDSVGNLCAGRSAYDRYGGREPQCFAYDIGYR